MSDNKDNAHFLDKTVINLNDELELQYWSDRFGVSIEQLKDAVRAVGDNIADVESNLANRASRKL